MENKIYSNELERELGYFEEKYSDFEISKTNRRMNQKAECNRMVVDGAGLKDTFRIKRERYIKKYGQS